MTTSEKTYPAGDGWVENVTYVLDKCPLTVRVRNNGSEDLGASLSATFRKLQGLLSGENVSGSDTITLTAEQADISWEVRAEVLLKNCPHTIRVREGGGPEDLLSSLTLTFQKMEHQLFERLPPVVGGSVLKDFVAPANLKTVYRSAPFQRTGVDALAEKVIRNIHSLEDKAMTMPEGTTAANIDSQTATQYLHEILELLRPIAAGAVSGTGEDAVLTVKFKSKLAALGARSGLAHAFELFDAENAVKA